MIFTKILALATLILGLVGFFSFFDVQVPLSGLINNEGIFFGLLFFLLIAMGFAVLIPAFILLIKESIKLFYKKNK